MKIAFFATGVPWLRPSGGKEKRVWEIAKHMAKKHGVCFVCPGNGYNGPKDSVLILHTRTYNTKYRHLNYVLNKLFFLFNAHKYLPYSYDIWYCSRTPIAAIWSKAKKIADCSRLWIWHWSPITILDNISNLLGYLFSDKRIFNSKKNKKGKGIVIPIGIDTNLFRPKKTKKIYDALFVGRKEKAKGYHDFLKIMRRKPGYRFKIVAGGVDEKDLPEIYRQSRVYLLPSYGESFSQTVVESLACGTPVIAYDVIADELKPFCRIIKKGDWKAMADNMEKPIIVKTNKNFLKKFSKEEYLKKMENVIESCC